jgi:hypothetical protein
MKMAHAKAQSRKGEEISTLTKIRAVSNRSAALLSGISLFSVGKRREFIVSPEPVGFKDRQAQGLGCREPEGFKER